MAVLLLAPAAMADPVLPGFNQPDYLNPAFDNPDIPGAVPSAPANSEETESPTATESPAASPSATASPSASHSASPSSGELPDTGGPSPVLPVSLVAALALVGLGFAARRLHKD